MNYVHLIGAEDVSRAGIQVASAAADLLRASGYILEAAQQISRAVEEATILIERLEKAINAAKEG